MGPFSIFGKAVKATYYQTQVMSYLDSKNPAYNCQINADRHLLNYFIDFCFEACRVDAPIEECAELFELGSVIHNLVVT